MSSNTDEPHARASLLHASLTRRELLKLGAVAWLAPHRFNLDDASPWSFAVFSDTHFGIPENYDKNRVLLEEIARFSPEVAILAGDVTERGWAQEYDEVDRALAGLGYRVHASPGNHEVRWAPYGLQLYGERVGPAHQVIEHRGCVFALLDTTVPLSHWGHVGGTQRRWLAQELQRFDRDAPVFVFLHHPTGRAGSVDDDDALGEVLARFNTRIVFTGHGHSDLLWDWRGLTCTMGKGLYQGSYQRVEVDPDAREVRIFRRTPEGLETTPFATVPLPRPPRPVPAAVPAREPVTSGALAHRWTQPLGGGVLSHLLLERDALYISAMDGVVYAIAPASGTVRWKASTGGYCHSSPVLADDALIVGSADAHVYAFDASSGKQRWRFATRGPVYASAAVAKGIAAIASGDGVVYGLDVASGKERWRFSLPPGPSAFAQSPAATDGERIFIGAWDRYVYALDAATGRELWKYAATPTSFYYSAAIAAPAVVGGRLYVPSNDNTLHALDTATGAPVWTAKTSGDKYGYSSPCVVDGRIYIGCLGDRGEVRCLAAEDGRELWVTATGSTIYESSPAVFGGHVAIGSVDGTLWLLDANDGRQLGSFRFPPGHFTSSPAAAGTRVYAATLAELVVGLEVSAAT
jgi:outer membrane protein assembly factor BamB